MWIIFTIATTLIWGFAEFFYKKGAHPDEQYSHLKICICVGFAMGLHAIFTLLTQPIHYNPANLIRYLPVSLLYILSMAFSFFGMRFIEESISDPIENTSGAICSLLCVLILGDKISVPAIISILIIVTGILGVGFLENRGETDRKKRIGKKVAIIAFIMPFLYAFLDAFGSFLDVFYLEDASSSPLIDITEDTIEAVANTSYELTFAFCAVILYIYIRRRNVKLELPKQKDKILAAVCETAGQLTYVYAMSGNGAIAAPIISSVCVVSLLLSRLFLKEKLSGKQYAFIFLIIIGIISLAIIEGE
ncbi:MAG: GRP family sugar transporter [Eubacteriales bacterium]|nr:GRP family sugar transporter [Eubacteriales bacterium]